MLKGHTKIELTNVKTGEVKVIEDDNLVTNAMSKMFEQTPYCGYSYNSTNPFTSSSPLIDRFCGGLLLFSEPIEEDPNNYLTPSGNKMVGNGRINYASGQDVPEFGAFNAEESSWDNATGERKYVYDFSTSKGNGTISCVALTNPLLGYYGLGNPSGKREALAVENTDYTKSYLPRNVFWGLHKGFCSSYSSKVGTPISGSVLFADYNKNCMYVFERYAFVYNSNYLSDHISNGKFTLYKIYFPMTEVNPMQRLGTDDVWYIQEKINIDVPSAISALNKNYTRYSCICRGDDAIYIIFTNASSQGVSANSNFHVWKISYDLETSEVFTLTNTTGVSIFVGDREQVETYNYVQAMTISNGYLICSAVGGRVFKIKLSDPTDVTEFENKLNPSSSERYIFYKMGGTIIAFDSYNCTRIGALNLNENTLLPVNGYPTFASINASYLSNVREYQVIPVRGCDNFVISMYKDYAYNSGSNLVRDPFMLSTINNLPEPVVKTSDMAMKITYTLKLADEQEAGDS